MTKGNQTRVKRYFTILNNRIEAGAHRTDLSNYILRKNKQFEEMNRCGLLTGEELDSIKLRTIELYKPLPL